MATTSPAAATLSPALVVTAAAAALTRDEAALATAIDCSTPLLARVADAVAALSCEAARWDAAAAFRSVPASKDHADVADDVKKLLLGSSNLAGGGATSAPAPFAKVLTFHGIFRSTARAFHAEAQTRLSAPAKSEAGSTGASEEAMMPLAGETGEAEQEEEALMLLARQLVLSAHSICKLSVDRARLCTASIADADLREKLAGGGIEANDLNVMLNRVVKVDSDAVSVLRGAYDYLLKLREVLAWEAAVAMAVIEMDSSIQKPHRDEENRAGSSTESKKKKMPGNGTSYVLTNDATDGKGDVPCVSSALVADCSTKLPPPQTVREKVKGDMKSKRKKTLGKGTSSVLVTDGKDVPCVNSALVTDWRTKLSLLFDPRCPKLESLVQKVKIAIESSEVRRRLPKIPKGTRDFGREKMPIRQRAFFDNKRCI